MLIISRIKKIMKLDEDVKMISAEAPVLFAKATEMFIHELTMRAWIHTEVGEDTLEDVFDDYFLIRTTREEPYSAMT